jgi:protein arginine kinase
MTGSSCPAGCGWRAIEGRGVSRLGQKAGAGEGAGDDPAGGGKPAGNERRLFRGDGQSHPAGQTILVERHLISREHAAKSSGSGLVFNREEVLRDDQRGGSFADAGVAPGLQLRQAWRPLTSLDSELEKKLDYAFRQRTGLFDGLPDESGHRHPRQRHAASAGPGAGRADQSHHSIRQQARPGRARALRRRHRGARQRLSGFQPNDAGRKRTDIVERLDKVLLQIIEHEENARQTLLEKKPKVVFNHIGRAYGILANAHSISSKETMNLLSLMRLGVDLGNCSRPRNVRWWTSCSS